MIYQLVKRDPAWMYLPYLTLLGAVAGLFVEKSLAAMVCGYLGLFVALTLCRSQQHATRLLAALPVAGRQLFLSRVSLMMVAIWLPAIAGGAAMLIRRGLAEQVLELAAMAAVSTLTVLATQSVRVRELSGPKWVALVFFYGACLIDAWLTGGWTAGPHAAIPALMVCMVLSGALFIRTWRAVPKSFQIAPEGTRGETPSLGGIVIPEPPRPAAAGTAIASRGYEPVTVWMPILRSVFSWQYGFCLPWIFFAAMSRTWIAACGFCLTLLWAISRQRVDWARALPMQPRVVLWTVLAPTLLTLALGYFASFHFGRHPPPVPQLGGQVLNLAAVFAWALLVVLFIALFDWRPLRNVSLVTRRVLLALLLGVPIVASYAAMFLLPEPVELGLLPNALLRISRALPGSLPVVIACAALPLAALGWALQRVFEEAEYADKPSAPQEDAFLQT